jgi:hypothetical protein
LYTHYHFSEMQRLLYVSICSVISHIQENKWSQISYTNRVKTAQRKYLGLLRLYQVYSKSFFSFGIESQKGSSPCHVAFILCSLYKNGVQIVFGTRLVAYFMTVVRNGDILKEYFVRCVTFL